MNVKNKAILWFTAGVFAALLISAVFAGFVRSSERNADKRIDEYAERSKAAEKLAEGIQQRTGDLEGQLQSAGNETSECIENLERVSQNLEDSKTAVIELQKLVKELRLQLTELKDEYLSACRSLERQKKAKKFWKGTALGCMILAVVEGIIIIFK